MLINALYEAKKQDIVPCILCDIYDHEHEMKQIYIVLDHVLFKHVPVLLLNKKSKRVRRSTATQLFKVQP